MADTIDMNALVKQVQQLAPLPAVALRVLEIAQDEKSSAADLASVIATDQAMTTKLLRIANSAYFAAGREVTTARDAIVMLGMMEVRRLVLTSALMGRFDNAGTMNVSSFWGHGLAVGMDAEVMARHTRLAPPEEAFTAGIIHDIGKLVMDQYLREQFSAATTLATSKGMPLERAEAEVFGFTHAQLGARLAEVWRLPSSLGEAIAHHHSHPEEEHGLPHVVAQANNLCRDHGLWCGFEDTEPGAVRPDTHVDDPMRAAVLAKLGGFERVIERANAFLGSSGLGGPKHAPAPAAAGRHSFPTPVPAPAAPQRLPSNPPPAPLRLPGAERPAWPSGKSPRQAPWVAPDRFPSDRLGRKWAR
jgi:putative nucleotidyltransferase with HDIG domain